MPDIPKITMHGQLVITLVIGTKHITLLSEGDLSSGAADITMSYHAPSLQEGIDIGLVSSFVENLGSALNISGTASGPGGQPGTGNLGKLQTAIDNIKGEAHHLPGFSKVFDAALGDAQRVLLTDLSFTVSAASLTSTEGNPQLPLPDNTELRIGLAFDGTGTPPIFGISLVYVGLKFKAVIGQ